MSSPFAPITVFYIGGVVAGDFFHITLKIILVIFLLSISASFYLFFRTKNIPALLILLNIFLVGFASAKFSKILPENHIANLIKGKKWCEITGIVISEPEIQENRIRFVLKSEKIIIEGKQKITTGKILVNSQDSSVEYGEKIEIKGYLKDVPEYLNPGVFSYRKYLFQKNIYKIIYVKEGNLRIRGVSKNFICRLIKNIYFLKNLFIENLKKSLPETYGEILASIIFGSKAAKISEDLEENFIKTGVIHIFVASGAQITLLLSISLLLLKINPSNKLISIISLTFSFAIILSYGIMTKADASIKRAIVMGCVYILAILLKKEYDVLNSLFLSAFLILIFSPQTVYNISFQLSFITCAGIIYFSPYILEILKNFKIKNFERLSYYIILTISVCVSSQLFVAPLIAYYFNRISPFSILTNIFVVPLVMVILPAGILGSIAGFLSYNFSIFFNSFNAFLLFLLLKIVLFFSKLPFSEIYVKSPSLFSIIFWYLLLIAIVELKRRKINISKEKIILISLFITAGFTSLNLISLLNRSFTVIFLDVGEGDSIFIETEKGRRILIDGGGTSRDISSEYDIGEIVLTPFLRKKGVKEIDIVVLTHPHNDHLRGLLNVLKNFRVKTVLHNGYEDENPFYEKFLSFIKEKNIKSKIIKYGDFFKLDDVEIKVLNPPVFFLKGTNSDIDNNGVVLKLKKENIKLLFAADIYKEGELEILKSKEDIQSDILKVAHHGSDTSSTKEFLEKVNPKISIISAGRDNPYGHPDREVLRRIKDTGSLIYRTDINGAIICKIKNGKISVKTFN